jgi:hypothetical protein
MIGQLLDFIKLQICFLAIFKGIFKFKKRLNLKFKHFRKQMLEAILY